MGRLAVVFPLAPLLFDPLLRCARARRADDAKAPP